MTDKTLSMKEQIRILEKQVEELREINNELAGEVEWLRSSIRLMTRQKYGSTSEKTPPEQLSLFDEAEVFADDGAEEPEITEAVEEKAVRKGGKKKRATRGAPITATDEYVDVSDEIKAQYGSSLRLITRDGATYEELIYHPASYELKTYHQAVYAVEGAYTEDGREVIIRAEMSPGILPKSFASEELLAKITCDKYERGMPLYRQEREFSQRGISLTRQTMANWMIRLSEDYLIRMKDHMHRKLLGMGHIMADETVTQVLHEEGREPQTKSYMWAYMSGRSEENRCIVFIYEPDRRYENAPIHLEGFRGYLQCDSYGAYDTLEGAVVVRDWAHARRKFQEAIDSAPEGTDIKGSVSFKMKEHIAKLFRIEKKLDPEKMSYERIREIRQEKSKPVVDEFFAEIREKLPQMPEQMRVHKACAYALKHEEDLRRYLDDGRLEISTNAIERKMKAFAVPRKNFLFANTVRGAEASASIFSLIESAKMNGLVPERYLTYIFKLLPGIDLRDKEQLEKIMPWADLPEELYIKVKRS